MIALGIILLVLGYFMGIGILSTLGVVLLVVGIILMLLGTTEYAVGGRRHWF
jgi:membrane-bound ClpP family serine protease